MMLSYAGHDDGEDKTWEYIGIAFICLSAILGIAYAMSAISSLLNILYK